MKAMKVQSESVENEKNLNIIDHQTIAQCQSKGSEHIIRLSSISSLTDILNNTEIPKLKMKNHPY